MNFEWHPAKARQNRRKHRITFQEASTVFRDPLSLTIADQNHSILEQRFITIGGSSNGRVLVVAHLEEGENIRIVSARRASDSERKKYEEEH